MSDRLLTQQEAAALLDISEEELTRLVEKGEVSAYQIGGMYLRFKEDQIRAFKEMSKVDSPVPGRLRPSDSPESDISEDKGSFFSKIGDFLYFNDFYIISAFIIMGLVYIILKSIR